MWHTTAASRPNPSGRGSATVDDGSETLVYQATLEARAGRYVAALGLLDRLVQAGVPPSPGALDLRARICAQLGFALEAERLWSAAAQADPGNPLYPLALARLREVRRSGPSLGAFVATLGAGALLLWILGQGLQIATAVSDLRAQLAATAASAQVAMDEARQDSADLRGDMRQAFGEVRAAVGETQARLTASDESAQVQIATAVSDLRAQLAATAASAQVATDEARRDIADLRTDTRQAFGEVHAVVSDTKAQLTASDESAHGEIGAVRQGIEALRADTDQALRGVQATIRDLSERMAAKTDSAEGGLNAVRRDMESARGETREVLGEIRAAIVGLVNQLAANPVQHAAQSGSATPAPVPTQPQETETQVADPDALSTPAGDLPEGTQP